jgi:response regulator RpfG family c-di-GMP phosphodiesterase
MNDVNDLLVFSAEDEPTPKNGDFAEDAWAVLVVDDDPEVHAVTRLALKGFEFAGLPLDIHSAYSAKEARELMSQEGVHYAIALLDVVMESDHAGLNLARWIRSGLNDPHVRIVLRTGQPGQAPEREVVCNYDIHDYTEKTELTANKLFTLMYSGLRSYSDMMALYKSKQGLEAVVKSSAKLFAHQSIEEFTQGALQQLSSLLNLNVGAVYSDLHSFAAEHSKDRSKILAATGRFASCVAKQLNEALSAEEFSYVQQVLDDGGQYLGESVFVGVYESKMHRKHILFIEGFERLSETDTQLLQLFGQNIGVAFDSQSMFNEVELTQREMVYRLSEAVESRSKETSNHVKRMALSCKILGSAYGLDERETEVLYKAAPLHDIGKIAIPDNILNKPGKLTPEEWEVMKSHAQVGYDILATSELEVLRMGAVIAGGHHENWDGSGYPKGVKGEDIHVYARIAALADVFDALVNKRSYKDSWPLEDALQFIEEMRGIKFDPALVDLLFDNQKKLMTIQSSFAD